MQCCDFDISTFFLIGQKAGYLKRDDTQPSRICNNLDARVTQTIFNPFKRKSIFSVNTYFF